jgi:hypothetical protein
MFRSLLFLPLVAAVAVPASATSYSAKLTVPTMQRIIARDISWACSNDACQGATVESRPAVICESLARRAGRLDTFLVDGRAFTSSELGKCNASAKPAVASSAIAAK